MKLIKQNKKKVNILKLCPMVRQSLRLRYFRLALGLTQASASR